MSEIVRLDNRQDKFGYYQVSDLKFYSKLEAIEHEKKSGKPIKWHFNSEVFTSYDWSVEPTESLSELYRVRAQQLRDDYDYLVLWLSGGADSTNILNTFINNDIKLDEVASYVNYDATKSTTGVLNGEVYNRAAVLATQAQCKQPHLQHRIIDLSKLTVDFYSAKNRLDWIYCMNAHFSPNNVARQDIKLAVPDWRKMFDSGKRVAFIGGIDKPQVINLNNNYYFRFVDIFMDNLVSPYQQLENRPWEFTEPFYWAPECAKMLIKQGHVVKNFIKNSPTFKYSKLATSVAITVDKTVRYLDEDCINQLIYPGWEPNIWQAKSPSLITSFRDQWFFNSEKSNHFRQGWEFGLKELWQSILPHHKRNRDNILHGLAPYISGAYNLGN